MILVQVTTKLQDATANKILLELQNTTTGYYYNCKILLQLQDSTISAEYYDKFRIKLQLHDTSTGYYYNCKILL